MYALCKSAGCRIPSFLSSDTRMSAATSLAIDRIESSVIARLLNCRLIASDDRPMTSRRDGSSFGM